MAEEVKTFRDRLAEALGEHTPHVGWGAGKWSTECLNTECRYFASGNGGVHHATAAFNAHVADHLIASGLVADHADRIRAESIVCHDYPDCDREHAGGAGGTPIHPPADAVICPGGYDCPPASGVAAPATTAHVLAAQRDDAQVEAEGLRAEVEALRAKLRDMEIERNMLRSTLAEVPERLVAERDHPSRAWNDPTARGERDMLWGDWFREGMDTAINTIRADDASSYITHAQRESARVQPRSIQ